MDSGFVSRFLLKDTTEVEVTWGRYNWGSLWCYPETHGTHTSSLLSRSQSSGRAFFWLPLREVGLGAFLHTSPSLLQPPAWFLLDLTKLLGLSGGCQERVQLPSHFSSPSHEGPHLLQHVLSKVLLLVHLQDGLPDLLVRKLQPEVKPQPLSSVVWALCSAQTPDFHLHTLNS